MKDLDQISATLEYGRFYSGTLKKFVLVLIVLCLIICLFCISFGILVICLSEVWEGVVFILFGALFGALDRTIMILYSPTTKQILFLK